MGATVQIENPVSHYNQTAKTDNQEIFAFPNIPYNNYHLSVIASGFQNGGQDVDVRSPLPLDVKIGLMIGTSTQTVEVTAEAADLLENDSTAHTDVDRALFEKLPLESQSSSLSSLVTLVSPGVSADSNGLFHGLGDHASKLVFLGWTTHHGSAEQVFSNQIPSDAVQSMEVIEGAPPAEYGDKTSLVIDVTTRSGLGVRQPHGRYHGVLWHFWYGERWLRSFLWPREMGQFLLPPMVWTRVDFSTDPSFRCITTMATKRMSSIALT